MSSRIASRHCSATTKAGEPCRAYAVRGEQMCSAHSRAVGAPAGNQNRRTHGFYAASVKMEGIGDVADDLLRKQQQLSAYIDSQMVDGLVDSEEMIKLFALLAQNASRLGRLLRDKRALDGDSPDGMLEAIGKLFDEINTEGILGVKL